MARLALKGGEPVRREPFPEWPVCNQQELEAVTSVIKSGNWFRARGHMVDDFEAEFAQFQKASYAIAVTNGSHAIEVALAALDIGPGDEVIVPDYTFMATASAVLYSNAVPIFVDVDEKTFCIDPKKVEDAITERTKAIIPVHFAGHPANLDALDRIVSQHRLNWIEDSAHAHGAEWNGKKIGTFANLGTFSMQASKTMTAGEGGAIITNDKTLAEECASIANCGRRKGEHNYRHFRLASNYRMTELQAAILRVQLRRLPEHLDLRNKNARYLTEQLQSIPGIITQQRDSRVTIQGLYLYPFLYEEEHFEGLPRDMFARALKAEGMPVERAYPALHEVEMFTERRFRPRGCPVDCPYYQGRFQLNPEDFPVSSRLSRQMVWISHRALLGNTSDMDTIVEAIWKIKRNCSELLT